jgi:tetratricopeptide (TPR) repeat protein
MLRCVLIVWGCLLLCSSAAFAQNDPRVTLLEREGWDALASNQPHAAAEAFQKALAFDPKRSSLHLGAGAAAYLEGRDEEAQAALERALELNPQSNRAREILGLVLYRRRDLSGAIRAYEGFSAGTLESGELRPRLERWRYELDLHNRMNSVAGSTFTVSFEGPADAELARRALASIDRAAQRIGQILSAYPLDTIPVVLYTSEQFRDITRGPGWAAGAYDGTVRVPMRGALENEKELDRVLAHEFTHALVYSLAPRGVPAWLNEGLATALERDDASELETAPRELPVVPLAALQTSFGRFTGDQAKLAYATSANATRRLLAESGGLAVTFLLRDLGDGVDFETAFLHRIQRPFSTFESDVAQSLP